MTGEIVSIHKTGCDVLLGDKLYFCLVKLWRVVCDGYEKPVVGDRVRLEQKDDKYIVKEILERKNFVARYDFYKSRYQGLAANVDTAFIITGADREFSANKVSRFLKLLEGDNDGEQTEIRKVIVVTKTDLTEVLSNYKLQIDGVEQIFINAKETAECAKLLDYLKKGGTGLLLGSSGVGKSTIVNNLCGLNLKTNEVQGKKFGNKGKHTTSARTMYFLNNGKRIIDSPGVKIVGLESDSLAAGRVRR